MTIQIECSFEPPHTHEYPDDWIFGGATGDDPRADRRWHPTTYEYYNDRLERIAVTQVPLCDDEALDYFTKVGEWGKNFNPVWLWAVRPEGITVLPFTYDKSTDTVYPSEE